MLPPGDFNAGRYKELRELEEENKLIKIVAFKHKDEMK